jgi:hypothetical protein
MLMEFNLADWPQDDKEWVKQRKLQWKELEPQLKSLQHLTRKNLVTLRTFFLTGHADWDELYLMDISHFILMRLHPKQTYENLKLIYDATQTRWQMSETLKHLRFFYSVSVRSAQGDCYDLGSEGMFGRLDEIYARVFYADPLHIEKKDSEGKLFPKACEAKYFSESYLGCAAFFLLGITRYPYVKEQYLAETWYESFAYAQKDISKHRDMPMFLQSIYYFDELHKLDETGSRCRLASELKTILDERPLPENLAKLWASTKTELGRDFSEIDYFKKHYLGQSACPCGYID